MFSAFRASARAFSATISNAGPTGKLHPEAAKFLNEREAIRHHAASSGELWRKITYYVAFPAIIVGYLNGANLMAEHEAHLEHIKEENGGEAPERIVYPYMNKRIKDYPWAGNYTLFYNPKVNLPLPDEE